MLSLLREPVRKIPSPLRRRYFLLKKFLTIQEQIGLLKARKLVIDNEQEAASYLLSNNYYNIINGYGKYFPQSNDTYSAGTSFDEISKLYLFDKEIKQFLFQAILTAEAHLKAIFAHRFAETYKDIPYSYLNINCYERTISNIFYVKIYLLYVN